jgi:hypothetical protein
VCERHELFDRILLNTKLVSAAYDPQTCLWSMQTDRDDAITARFLIMGCGPLSTPRLPVGVDTAIRPSKKIEKLGRMSATKTLIFQIFRNIGNGGVALCYPYIVIIIINMNLLMPAPVIVLHI